jgi:two-component sensor histidine kinase
MSDRIRLTGAEVHLQPATAQTLALALHELVTNSAKYGALSALAGQLSIDWKVDGDALALTWEETGGPEVREPTSRGFGTRSLMASVESQLGGQAVFDWRAEGLVCRLHVPLTRKSPASAEPGGRHSATASEPPLQRASA